MGIGSLKVAQIAVCVWDLYRAERCWTNILGIAPSKFTLTGFQTVPAYTRGLPDNSLEGIELLIYQLDDGLTLEVYGPCPKGTPWQDFLEKHGEGVINIAFYVPDRKAAYTTIGEECDVKLPYHAGFFPDCTYSFMDTTKELGFELNIKQLEDNMGFAEHLRRAPADYKETR